jgi:hypothetical protein
MIIRDKIRQDRKGEATRCRLVIVIPCLNVKALLSKATGEFLVSDKARWLEHYSKVTSKSIKLFIDLIIRFITKNNLRFFSSRLYPESG